MFWQFSWDFLSWLTQALEQVEAPELVQERVQALELVQVQALGLGIARALVVPGWVLDQEDLDQVANKDRTVLALAMELAMTALAQPTAQALALAMAPVRAGLDWAAATNADQIVY